MSQHFNYFLVLFAVSQIGLCIVQTKYWTDWIGLNMFRMLPSLAERTAKASARHAQFHVLSALAILLFYVDEVPKEFVFAGLIWSAACGTWAAFNFNMRFLLYQVLPAGLGILLHLGYI